MKFLNVIFLAIIALLTSLSLASSETSTLTVKPGAKLSASQPGSWGSIATLKVTDNSIVVGADIAFTSNATVSGAAFSGPPFNYYYAKLFGDIGSGNCCAGSVPPWGSVTFTPT